MREEHEDTPLARSAYEALVEVDIRSRTAAGLAAGSTCRRRTIVAAERRNMDQLDNNLQVPLDTVEGSTDRSTVAAIAVLVVSFARADSTERGYRVELQSRVERVTRGLALSNLLAPL